LERYYIYRRPNPGYLKDKNYGGSYSWDELRKEALYRHTYISPVKGIKWRKAADIPELKDIVLEQNEPGYFDYEIPSPASRYSAQLINTLYICAFMFIPVSLFGVFSDMGARMFLLTCFLTIVFFMFFTVFWFKIFNGTIGHTIMKLKVISSISGEDYTKSREYYFFNVYIILFLDTNYRELPLYKSLYLYSCEKLIRPERNSKSLIVHNKSR